MCNTISLMSMFSLFFQLYGIRDILSECVNGCFIHQTYRVASDILSEYVNGCFIHQTYRVASANSTHPLSF